MDRLSLQQFEESMDTAEGPLGIEEVEKLFREEFEVKEENIKAVQSNEDENVLQGSLSVLQPNVIKYRDFMRKAQAIKQKPELRDKDGGEYVKKFLNVIHTKFQKTAETQEDIVALMDRIIKHYSDKLSENDDYKQFISTVYNTLKGREQNNN